MDDELLCQLGLTKPQALAYRSLVLRKSARPSQIAKLIGESRTNTYAILDRLVELGLAYREDVNKRYTYYPESPEKLESLLLAHIADKQKDLAKLRKRLPEMMTAFEESKEKPAVTITSGKDKLNTMYDQQTQQEDRFVRFIRSIHDIGFLGHSEMTSNRQKAKNAGKRRLGITPPTAWSRRQTIEGDNKTALKRRWLPAQSYTAAVEWAVSGDELQILCFKGEGYGLTIRNPEIAEAFRQLFDQFYARLPSEADGAHM